VGAVDHLAALIDQLAPIGGSRAPSARRPALVQIHKKLPGFGYRLNGAPARIAT
jgi:hypothetical protein